MTLKLLGRGGDDWGYCQPRSGDELEEGCEVHGGQGEDSEAKVSVGWLFSC